MYLVFSIILIQFHRAIRENTVLTVIVHPIEIKSYLLIYYTKEVHVEIHKKGRGWLRMEKTNTDYKLFEKIKLNFSRCTIMTKHWMNSTSSTLSCILITFLRFPILIFLLRLSEAAIWKTLCGEPVNLLTPRSGQYVFFFFEYQQQWGDKNRGFACGHVASQEQ